MYIYLCRASLAPVRSSILASLTLIIYSWMPLLHTASFYWSIPASFLFHFTRDQGEILTFSTPWVLLHSLISVHFVLIHCRFCSLCFSFICSWLDFQVARNRPITVASPSRQMPVYPLPICYLSTPAIFFLLILEESLAFSALPAILSHLITSNLCCCWFCSLCFFLRSDWISFK